MINLVLCDFTIRAAPVDEASTKVPAQVPRRCGIRVIFDDESPMREALPGLCAKDCWPIQLLDVDKRRYGEVFYDRKFKRDLLAKVGMKPDTPTILWWPTPYIPDRLIEALSAEAA